MTRSDQEVDRRIRALVPGDGEADWDDVRRRARRKAIPTIVAAGLIIGALLAAPAVGFRNQFDDLWADAEPEKNLYVRAIADCGEGTFTLEMDPKVGAVVLQDGETLARATMTERELGCAGRIRSLKSTPDAAAYTATDRRSYAATVVTCETEVPLEIGVNPIWYDDRDTGQRRINGSTLLVAERGTLRLFASAILRTDPDTGRNWSAAHWDSRVCSAETD
jgi:hypothetical protein